MGQHSQKLNDNPDEHWAEAQAEEQQWWGNCANTMWEETKQLEYAKLMGIKTEWDDHGPYFIDLHGKSVLDIGGGPVSLLLKASRKSRRTVVDPCKYPDWVAERYKAHGIEYLRLKGEQVHMLTTSSQPLYDEVWMYNVLQHTDDPGLIIANAFKALNPGGKLRFMDWVDTDTNIAHPHCLTKEKLEEWIGQMGDVVEMTEKGCYGKAFYGVFTKPGPVQII